MRWMFLLALCWPLAMRADLDFEPVIESYELTPRSEAQMKTVAENFEVVRRLNEASSEEPLGRFEVYVPIHRAAEWVSIAPQARRLSADIAQDLERELVESHNFVSLYRYRSWQEVEETLHQLADEFPEIVELGTYGTSLKGRSLYFLKVSDHVKSDEDETELLLTSATHGDELITVEVVLNLLEELLRGYGRDERITQMIHQKELYFIPVVNPDGFQRRNRYSNGVDPNRAYPRPGGNQRYQIQCIEHLISFFHSRQFAGSMDFHAHGRLVMYPWAHSYDSPEHQAHFQNLAGRMVRANGYRAGQVSQILYAAPGSSADYYYWQKKTQAFGIELARRKAPSSSRIGDVIDEAREMTWQFIEGVEAPHRQME